MSSESLKATDYDENARPEDAEEGLAREHKIDKKKKEIGGRDGPDPTRFGDWEKNGRCVDF